MRRIEFSSSKSVGGQSVCLVFEAELWARPTIYIVRDNQYGGIFHLGLSKIRMGRG